ncbi:MULTISPECIES: glycogen debranching protein [unclassified Prochlorococcus]|uniref:glycogen debranching protein n=1 Tax=unclassified Prochlorococcus TaxID=2627481 RepID=UPI0005339509|nr:MULTISPECIES: isoamylase [unclassified Prochlorococcus]KGG16237.1 Glycogen debranching enzyme [Prochlorococcus sp. MIT 0603]KGG18028.1 Glycogen debranching enzyme [Prochlorococcus sp. MIT 0602]
MLKTNLGTAYPLGSTITKRGVNFSVAAPNAVRIELLLFEKENDCQPIEIIYLNKENKSGDYWHIEVEGVTIGSYYGYRVYELETVVGDNFNTESILLDPCARSIAGWDAFQRNPAQSNLLPNPSNCLKGVVCERAQFNFNDHPRPRHSWNNTIIYELHVGGFTRDLASGVTNEKRGTYLGLMEKIPYIKDLGITAIELLPVFSFDPSDSPFGLENHWGYSPINWFTPHQGFVSRAHPLTARDQFRKLVETCHDNHIEVFIDVVYNHTTEGNGDGPLLSWKGFGESSYYHINDKKEFLDVTGCGNTIAANEPIARQLILESLRCWANELGVDGFRFDLGISLSRGKDLAPLDFPPIFEEIESDPFLSEIKLISEPWDCGGLYRLADFPAQKISTWNGHFRDDLRKFWKGDKDTTWPLKDRLMGSPKIYKDNENSVKKSINFITSHDGFTLIDLVSFNKKYNLSNGENNRDGENHNNSWNHGIEGPTTKKYLNNIRSRQQRNLLTNLILTPGIPMMLMGDEVGRSQGGNNNTWCQNNSLGWMIWDQDSCDYQLRDFVKKLINIRKDLLAIFSPEKTHGLEPNRSKSAEGFWLQWHGVKVNAPDWSSWSHTICYSINQEDKGSAIWFGLNGYEKSMKFELPKPISSWVKVIDTSFLENHFNEKISNQHEVEIESRSLVLLMSKDFQESLTT